MSFDMKSWLKDQSITEVECLVSDISGIESQFSSSLVSVMIKKILFTINCLIIINRNMKTVSFGMIKN